MNQRERGFSVPLILILVLVLMAVPAYYWLNNNRVNYSTASEVRGISSLREEDGPGFSVTVESQSPTWDFVQYLCKTKTSCVEALNTGYRLSSISGGQTEAHEVVVRFETSWKDYEFIKYYVRPSWYAKGAMFNVTDLGEVPGAELVEISDEGEIYDVVVTPVSVLENDFFNSATFSDK